MSNLKLMEQQLAKAGSVKGMLQLPFVKERAIKNYQATTGRKDSENWFQQEAFAMMSIFAEKPDFMKCEPLSIMACLVKAGTLGLRISDGHIDLIKYGNILKADPNYKGHREQLRRMESIESIGEAQLVFKGDEFVEDKLNGRISKHEGKVPTAITMDVIVAAYVRIKFKSGEIKDVVVYHDELVKAKNKSKNLKDEGAPWHQFPGEMCKKVAIHRANKNYYRRPDHEVIIDPVEGEVEAEETQDILHEVQPQATEPPTQEEHVKEPPKEVKVTSRAKYPTDEEMQQYLKER